MKKILLILLFLSSGFASAWCQSVVDTVPSKSVHSLSLGFVVSHTALKDETVSPLIFSGIRFPLNLTLGSRGAWQYTKPVVVLTNQRVFSTVLNFVMMMQVQPHVTTLGTITGNGVNGGVTRELPNGWLLNVPSGLVYLPDKTVVEGKGIKPKIEAFISEEQKKNGQDAILEKALALLK
jgi:Peptidase family S41